MGWRGLIVGGAVMVGLVGGFAAGSLAASANSEYCADGTREVTYLPPGMRCGFGSKDGVVSVPWDSDYTSPMEAVPLALVGAGVGAVLLGLPARRVMRGRLPATQ